MNNCSAIQTLLNTGENIFEKIDAVYCKNLDEELLNMKINLSDLPKTINEMNLDNYDYPFFNYFLQLL
jgi:hypothetical protein